MARKLDRVRREGSWPVGLSSDLEALSANPKCIEKKI